MGIEQIVNNVHVLASADPWVSPREYGIMQYDHDDSVFPEENSHVGGAVIMAMPTISMCRYYPNASRIS